MAFIVKTLGANIAIVSGTHDLYTAPTNGSAIVSSVRLVNLAANSATVNLYAKPSAATERRLIKKDTVLAAGASVVMEDLVTLSQGDKIQLNLAAAAAYGLNWMVNGLERE